ncbi:FAD:protein FMN transferase [Saccharothrix violaceirubra]|uniref:FAD:protein FMN transferase n=1 Tax=Saccharothrix violaceirubra TaxID=413306 RepID=A0A7W7T5I1_9PSEU|nr:FAD:protein FMN transferase [Saccharothrix violaceirubra]MBB4966952.1 thiamine biosynthesis lipoprotein [Saccharothrix violaceirubra]
MTGRYVAQVMGMPVSLALRGRHVADGVARAAWDAVVAELRAVDRVFSRFRTDSFLSRLGRGEIGVADCPPEVAEVLELGARAERESYGAFSVRRRVDGESVLDTDGVVKGWAAERAARWLELLPDTDFCLSAGGDLVCRAESVPWRVGVEDPFGPGRVVAVVPVVRGGVATSGTAHRGAHLVDARTGLPARGIASVTVVADSLTWADVDATAAWALGGDAVEWLASRGRGGLVVWADGSIAVVSSGGVVAG